MTERTATSLQVGRSGSSRARWPNCCSGCTRR